jgi:hypothetical protein
VTRSYTRTALSTLRKIARKLYQRDTPVHIGIHDGPLKFSAKGSLLVLNDRTVLWHAWPSRQRSPNKFLRCARCRSEVLIFNTGAGFPAFP